MRRLDRRGTAALEFSLVAAPLFTAMFLIMDLGRYAITLLSLQVLADAEARACYLAYNGPSTSVSSCAGNDYLTDTQKQAVASFLYAGSLTPKVTISAAGGGNVLTITAQQPNFKMFVPLWGKALDAPSVTASLPF